jgi:hypothetical protein
MRKLLLCGVLLCLFAASAEAQRYRGGWCLVANLGRGFVHENCSFRSFEACRAEASSFGSTSFCRVSGYPTGGEPRRVKKRSKSRNY